MKDTIKKASDFKNIYTNGKSQASKNLVLYVLKSSAMERNRYGISVSHKVGNSVVRHTLIRRIREIYRKNVDKIKEGYDLIIVLRVGSDKTEFIKLNEEFLQLCKRQDILEKED